ncbi:unnamed protein product [Plutella xylostella]|uniref:(diamondback moth) hypothetical protein n=1 Tax=Plutella xylostella TaxID=51655 RepID=A0A8S4G918_PLUXY|nr:unnamed protein product [Plutella xylostella]
MEFIHLLSVGKSRAFAGWFPDLRAVTPRPNDTARVFQVEGHAGRVGFISSMTHAFCSSCNRLRLTADGNLKVCLFGSAEVSLRDALRGGAEDEELAALIRQALMNKKPQHAGQYPPPHMRPPGILKRTRHVMIVKHAEPQGYEKPAHDFDRWLASYPSPPPLSLLQRPPAAVTSRRAYSSLSHVDGAGRARMVDVAHKPSTERAARAECALHVAAPVLALLRGRRVAKGDALAVAEVAGVLAAKRTADLIPLCHSLALSSVRVWVTLPPAGDAAGDTGGALRVVCEARAGGRTGVEMEALTGAALAALTLYDMCKAADPRMRITDLRVTRKQGGKRDFSEEHENEQTKASESGGPPESEDPPKPSGPPKSGDPPKSNGPPKKSGGPPKSSGSPADPKEPFAPVNFMYF